MNERVPIPDHIIAILLVGFFLVVMLIIYLGNRSSDRYWARRREMENEELREQAAFDYRRRERAQAYFLDKIHAHDREVMDYAIEKKIGLLDFFRSEPEPQKPTLRIHDYRSPPRQPHQRAETFRQPEPPRRERVVVITEPSRERPPPRNRLPFWGDDDDDVIDITPSAPNPHRAMPQAPIALLGAPRNRGGRPRKHSSNAAKQSAYNQRKKQS